MIKITDVTKSYGEGESKNQVLKGVSFEVENNDYLVILGASGSGKSTLLNVMSGLEGLDSGSVSYDGENIADYNDAKRTSFRKDSVGFIF